MSRDLRALRERLNAKQRKLDQLGTRIEDYRDRMHDMWDRTMEERRRRKWLEREALADEFGVVQVGPQHYMWTCACGSRGKKAFSTRTECREAMGRHHERMECILTVGPDGTLVPV